MLLLDYRLVPYYISLIHSLIEVVVDLLALLVYEGAAFVDDFDLLALLTLDRDLESFLLLSDIINLFLKVYYQSLYRIY